MHPHRASRAPAWPVASQPGDPRARDPAELRVAPGLLKAMRMSRPTRGQLLVPSLLLVLLAVVVPFLVPSTNAWAVIASGAVMSLALLIAWIYMAERYGG